jgi:hypothetical protein
MPARLAGCRCTRDALQLLFDQMLYYSSALKPSACATAFQRGLFFRGKGQVMVWVLVVVLSREGAK